MIFRENESGKHVPDYSQKTDLHEKVNSVEHNFHVTSRWALRILE